MDWFDESLKQAFALTNNVWLTISLALNVVFGLVFIIALGSWLNRRGRTRTDGQPLKDSLAISNIPPVTIPTEEKPLSEKEVIGEAQPVREIKTDPAQIRPGHNWLVDFFAMNKIGLKEKQGYERYAIIFLGIAIFINLVAIVFQSLGDFSLATTNAKLATFFWAFSVVLAGLSAGFFTTHSLKAKTENEARARYSIRDIIFNKAFLSLFPILLAAFVLRVIPVMNTGLQLDEWYWLDSAKYILKGIVVSPFAFIGDYPTNLPAYPLAFLTLIIRNPMLAVRLTGVIYSLVAISLVYFFVKKTLGFTAAVCGAWLMAFSAWDIHMSGLGYLNVNISPMLVAGILFLLYQVWEQKYTFWTLFGLAFLTAVCIHLLYVPTFLAAPVGLVLLIHWVKRPNSQKTKEIILFGLFFFICMSPIIQKLIQYPDTISRHSDYLQQNLYLSSETGTPLDYYWAQLLLLGKDYIQGDFDIGRQGLWGITFDPLVLALSMAGIALIVIQVARKKRDAFWLVITFTFFVQLFVPFILLYRTESVWRAFPVLPLVYLFTIFALVEISSLMNWIVQRALPDKKNLYPVFMTVTLALYFMINLPWFVHFFSVYAVAQDTYENTTCRAAAKLIAQKVPEGSVIYMADELCFPLVSILFDYYEDQYQFIKVRSGEPVESMEAGNYVLLFNSRNSGYFLGDIQTMLERKMDEYQAKMVSSPFDTLPVLYLIKK